MFFTYLGPVRVSTTDEEMGKGFAQSSENQRTFFLIFQKFSPILISSRCPMDQELLFDTKILSTEYLVTVLLEGLSKCPIQTVRTCYYFLDDSNMKLDKDLRFSPFDIKMGGWVGVRVSLKKKIPSFLRRSFRTLLKGSSSRKFRIKIYIRKNIHTK